MPDRAQARLIAPLMALAFLCACTPRDFLFSGIGATGIASMQDRGVDGALSDYKLRLTLNESYFHNSIDLYGRAVLMISKGRLVIIGRVPTQEMHDLAGRLAVEAGHLKSENISNRLTIGPDLPMSVRLNDESIALRLDGTLTFDGDVSALNYDVESKDGVVYVIGEAGSEREKRRVIFVASHLSGVKSVEAFINVAESAP